MNDWRVSSGSLAFTTPSTNPVDVACFVSGQLLSTGRDPCSCPESLRAIVGAAVRNHLPHFDCDGSLEEGECARFAPVGHVSDKSDVQGIVDADMELDSTRILSRDAVPDTANPAKLLDVEMDELAGMLTPIAAHRLGRFQAFKR